MRGTSNGNAAGSSYARRRRKQWLLDTFGDGTTCPCSFEGCDVVLTFETVSTDRYPLAGIEGGTYRRDNIRPACLPHNIEHGSRLGVERKAAKRAARVRMSAVRMGWAALVECDAQRPPKTLGLVRVL